MIEADAILARMRQVLAEPKIVALWEWTKAQMESAA
jgi:hypothetical protein